MSANNALSWEEFKQAARNHARGQDFLYGPCLTDCKSGQVDDIQKCHIMGDKEYAPRIQAMLETLNLPWPKARQIHRGHNHDLLFLASHGVVLRIGYMDLEDLLNPAILQPLGWLNDGVVSIAIYPGIGLLKTAADLKLDAERGSLRKALDKSGQRSDDCHEENIGVVRLQKDETKEDSVGLLLDMDNSFNGTIDNNTRLRGHLLKYLTQKMGNRADALHETLRHVFSRAHNPVLPPKYLEAFAVHQPLRRLFWEAFGEPEDKKPRDEEALKTFWDACVFSLQNPNMIALPAQRMQRSPKGLVFTQETAHAGPLVLLRPWTGKNEDQSVRAKIARRISV